MFHVKQFDIEEWVSENVSRETFSKLQHYNNLLKTWQKRINLVSPSSFPQVWNRHFKDSLQLLPHIPEDASTLVDMGSGAGFPGLVLAICREKKLDVTLIESDFRKCSFLENVSRETFCPVKILNSRLEEFLEIKADIVTARGLAPLENLLKYADKFCHKDSTCLFLKGKMFEQEIEQAQKKWEFSLEIFPSLTDSTGRILKISSLKRIFIHD
jgi:16S rRNA (guanine527-N7)-methyltransferase